jgi:hypothetical protein
VAYRAWGNEKCIQKLLSENLNGRELLEEIYLDGKIGTNEMNLKEF